MSYTQQLRQRIADSDDLLGEDAEYGSHQDSAFLAQILHNQITIMRILESLAKAEGHDPQP